MQNTVLNTSVLAAGETSAEYLALCQDLVQYWRPGNIMAIQCVQDLLDAQWRIRRCVSMEAAALSKPEGPDYQALDIISRHETRLQKLQARLNHQLSSYACSRDESIVQQAQEAIRARRADRLAGRPTDLSKFDFGFSLEEVDRLIDIQDSMRAAAKSEQTKKEWRQ